MQLVVTTGLYGPWHSNLWRLILSIILPRSKRELRYDTIRYDTIRLLYNIFQGHRTRHCFLLAQTNRKRLRKVIKIVRRRMTVRRWHLETLHGTSIKNTVWILKGNCLLHDYSWLTIKTTKFFKSRHCLIGNALRKSRPGIGHRHHRHVCVKFLGLG